MFTLQSCLHNDRNASEVPSPHRAEYQTSILSDCQMSVASTRIKCQKFVSNTLSES